MDNLEFVKYAVTIILCGAVILIAFVRLIKMLVSGSKSKKRAKYQPTAYVQINTSRQVTGSPAASTGYRTIKGFLVKLDVEKQNRYVPGRNAYEMARTNGYLRSIIFRDANALQKILDEKAGTGEFIGNNKELVNFGQVIGQYVDIDGRSKRETKVGVIHYTGEGAYIVPARPDQGGVPRSE